MRVRGRAGYSPERVLWKRRGTLAAASGFLPSLKLCYTARSSRCALTGCCSPVPRVRAAGMMIWTGEVGVPVTRALAVLMLLAALSAPKPATAQSRTAVGLGTGVVAGALLGGPVGAVVGGMAGATIGASAHRPRYRVYRPARRKAFRSYYRHHRPAQRRFAQRYPVVSSTPKAARPEPPENPKANLPVGP